jgi:Glycosyltransferase
MKILFVTRGFPSETDPMNGNYEAVQAKAIAAKGHEVAVIAIYWKNLLHVFESRTINKRVVDGIHIYERIGLTALIPYLYFPQFEHWIRERQLKRVFREYVKEFGMPDVVHAHILSIASPAAFLKKDLNLPFVITEHWTQMNSEKTSKRIMNQTFIYQYADRVICVSDILASSLRKKCHVESLVINNMVSDQFFKSQRKDRSENTFKFIGVGALRKNKGFDILVDAFALCHFPENVTLDIVGEGEERHLIESKIRQHGLDRQVKMLGVKTPEEVNDLLCQSDCFVLSSRLETFAIVVIEAMAKGLPVIATQSGGPETFVRKEDGILVPKENVEELAKAMKNMIEHYQEYNGEEIRQHCHDNFSQDVIADKIINIYSQLII